MRWRNMGQEPNIDRATGSQGCRYRRYWSLRHPSLSRHGRHCRPGDLLGGLGMFLSGSPLLNCGPEPEVIDIAAEVIQ